MRRLKIAVGTIFETAAKQYKKSETKNFYFPTENSSIMCVLLKIQNIHVVPLLKIVKLHILDCSNHLSPLDKLLTWSFKSTLLPKPQKNITHKILIMEAISNVVMLSICMNWKGIPIPILNKVQKRALSLSYPSPETILTNL